MSTFPIGCNQHHDLSNFNLAMANRHGLIAGATGTGKTVTLQMLAEQFSQAGVCVFSADIKGDLTGIAMPASLDNTRLMQRVKTLKMPHYKPHGNPVVCWDIYGKSGHPLRTTISAMGPLLLGRILNLNDIQQGIFNAAFRIADDKNLLLIDIKDLSSLLDWIADNIDTLKSNYGNVTRASIGAIQRNLLTLQDAGGDYFFGEPAFNIEDLFQKDTQGFGVINLLDATKLVNDPRLYSTFLLWLLSTLFDFLPEVGEVDKPKIVFFFDEAHLFFNAAPKPLLEKIEQLVRLIRSKGVGVYFISQSPLDIPETVLGQLSNRIQHALRAYTPKDQKAVKVAAQTFRQNPELNTEQAITSLAVGEALVSLLDDTGTPTMVEKISIFPPASRIGAISEEEKTKLINSSPFFGKYEKSIDRESAYEQIKQLDNDPSNNVSAKPGRTTQSVSQVLLKSTARSLGSQLGRQLVRGILGSLFGKK